ncbi:formin-like protein 20 isoform X2 [Ischnura elegans]|nr:formin-like protein 20 isoform X2 [Ischnura elegans]
MGHGDQSPGSVGTEEQDSRSVANGDQGLRIVGHGNQGPRPPVAADYSPFNLAKRSAEENLRHQPLPDTVVDPNYQLMESQGAKHPGASLPMISRATAVSVRHKHPGPTHCTKSSIFRTVKPPTENPLSSLAPLGGKGDWGEVKTSKVHRAKVTDMDLAIGWDIYAPIKADGKDHIVGSAPSVFNIVPPPSPPSGSCGMPGGCGTPPGGCGTPPGGCGTPPGGCGTPPGGCRTPPRGCSMPPHNGIEKAPCSSKQTSPPHSKATSTATKSPPTSQHSSKPPTPMTAQRSRGSWQRPPPPRKAWEEKENNSPNLTSPINQFLGNEVRQCFSSNNAPQVAKDSSRQRRSHSTPNLTRNSTMGSNGTFHKSCGACNENPKSNSPQKNSESSSYKMAFKAGKPNNSRPVTAHPAGGSASTMSEGAKVRVPKPRAPYARRSYSISTLAPPFSLWPGNHRRGAREYPEHWRLASVYQHAYKPIHSRKRPLLSTVYQ